MTTIQGRFNRWADDFYCLNSPNRLTALEGFRALAIWMVFNVHFLGQYGERSYFLTGESFLKGLVKFFHSGHIGVDLFFVLSGFLIHSTLNKKRPSFRDYVAHRARRIFPAHVAVLFLLVFPDIIWQKFIGNALFLNSSLNAVTWSLKWEWAFYLVMFGFFTLGIKHKNYLYGSMLTLLLILLLAKTIENNTPDPGRFAGFFIGVLVAEWSSSRYNVLSTWRWRPLIITGLAGIFLSSFVWSIAAETIGESFWLRNSYYLLVSSSAGLLVMSIALNKAGGLATVLQLKPIRILGQISYSFYLVHTLVGLSLARNVLGEIVNFQEMLLSYLVAFAMSFIVSSALFYYFERPYFGTRKTA